MSVRDLIIVGAGPSGLSAAIAAKQRSLDYQVLEQGVLVNSIYRFPPQMVFFTTPELLEIGGLPFMSPYDKPTRAEALKYYRKVVDAYDLQICCDEQVLAIEREPGTGADGQLFAVETRSSKGIARPRSSRRSSTGFGRTSKTASRKDRSPRSSARSCGRSGRRRSSSRRAAPTPRRLRRTCRCRPTARRATSRRRDPGPRANRRFRPTPCICSPVIARIPI